MKMFTNIKQALWLINNALIDNEGGGNHTYKRLLWIISSSIDFHHFLAFSLSLRKKNWWNSEIPKTKRLKEDQMNVLALFITETTYEKKKEKKKPSVLIIYIIFPCI